jgi:hypothetical protein
MEIKTKIFCIGLNKTGTTTLHHAFEILGLKSVHFKTEKGENIKDIIEYNYKNNNEILFGIKNYDVYSDWNHPTTNFLYKEFDKQYPNSKFILNTRNLEDWLISREKHVKRLSNLKKLQKENPNHPWYTINIDAWRREYKEVHNDIFKYFENRPEDLLIFNVIECDNWEKLCAFLNFKVPNVEFPKSNSSSSFSLLNKIKHKLKRLFIH